LKDIRNTCIKQVLYGCSALTTYGLSMFCEFISHDCLPKVLLSVTVAYSTAKRLYIHGDWSPIR